jgi:branched-chain amino acid transport system substrate-binding protein
MKARLAVALATAAVLSVVVAACGGTSSSSGGTISGTNLTIYSSLPLQGASRVNSVATNQGAQLALSSIGGKIGKYTITFKQLDDSTAAAGKWDPGQTTSDAHTACDNSSTIGYLGEFNSGSSAISIPILNRCGIPQISPANTAVGLTANVPGASPGEPQKYYPTGKRTYARVVPKDTVQAAAQVALQKAEGCTKTYVVNDQEVYGAGLAKNFQLSAPSQGLQVAANQGYDPKASNYRSLAASAAGTGANCVFISAITENNAVEMAKDMAAAMPKAKIFGPDGVAESTFYDPSKGGIPTSLDSRTFVTVATLAPSAYPAAGGSRAAAQAFFKAYQAKYGAPEPYAIYGYEAMSLMLDAIKRATKNGTAAASRSKVTAAIFATKNRQSLLGTYSIDANGDTTLTAYGSYKIVNGKSVFLKTIIPSV